MTSLVFDTTALSHFARAGRTETLRAAVASDEPVLLAEVAAELTRGAVGYPSLGNVATVGWLKKVQLEELPELAAFRGFKVGTFDRATVEAVVDDLIGTGMRLPFSTGADLFAWAYEDGILP